MHSLQLTMQSVYAIDAIRQQVRICLTRIKRNEAFIEDQLQASDYEIIKKGEDELMMKKFADFVSKSLLMKAITESKEGLLDRNLLETEITNFNPDVYSENASVPSENQKALAKENAASDEEGSEEIVTDDHGNKKRRRSQSQKPAQASNKKTKRCAKKGRQRLSEELRMESFTAYLAQKADVLEQVPECHKKHWGRIMFGRWKADQWRPVLVLGPFQVRPDLRDTWMKMFETTKGNPQRMWCWCYWYGSPVGEEYTPQKVSTLLSYENAVLANVHVLADRLEKKVDAGDELKDEEKQAIKGYACLEEELKKRPEERIPEKFTEVYDSICNVPVNEGSSVDEGCQDGSDDLESESDSLAIDPAPKEKAIAREKVVAKANTVLFVKMNAPAVESRDDRDFDSELVKESTKQADVAGIIRAPECARVSASKSAKESNKNGGSLELPKSQHKHLADLSSVDFVSRASDTWSQLRPSYRKYCGQIMFCKWRNTVWRPVLVLGPYQVPPRLRDEWIAIIERTKHSPWQEMQRFMCYFYGSPISKAFKLLTRCVLVSYEKAVSISAHVAPAYLNAKLDAGENLNDVEEHIMAGYACLEDELKKKPEDRIPEITDDNESIRDRDDELSLPGGGGSHDERNEFERESESLLSLPTLTQIAVTDKEENLAVKNMVDQKPAGERAPLALEPLPMETDDVMGKAELSDEVDDDGLTFVVDSKIKGKSHEERLRMKETDDPGTYSVDVLRQQKSKKNRIAFKISKNELRQLAEASKKEYTSQKADVLERVPASHQRHWGQIMFGKWKKDPWRPVLVLGPYQVHPDLRDTWMKMFENTKGDPQRMWCWCYWYGSPVGEAYSQQKASTLMSYEKAVLRKLHVLPANLQAKVDAGKKLKGDEKEAVKGYACLEDELKKKPEDRIPQKCTEDHENILTLVNEISHTFDDGFSDESDELERESDASVSIPIRKEMSNANNEEQPELKRANVRKPPNARCLPIQTSDVMVGNANEGDGHGHGLKFSPDWNWNIGGTTRARKQREQKGAQCSVCGRCGHNKRTCAASNALL